MASSRPEAPDFPAATYLVLASRLVPDLDGGFTIAALARARRIPGAQVLTFDPADAATHARHREVFARRGMLSDPARMRNLFDEAVAVEGGAADWLLAAADASAVAGSAEYRVLSDATGRPFLALPVLPGDPDWHVTTEPVLVYDEDGEVRGGLPGFRGLYRAWLQRVADEVRDRPVVVICESRQLGELIVDWADPRVRIVHTIHTIHLQSPYTPDAPMNPLWTRWFGIAGRFDAVLWPTRSQRDDVLARFGDLGPTAVVPNVVPPVAARSVEREPGLVVMVGRLAPGKRIDHAVRAFVAAEVAGARLEIWGGGPEADRLQGVIDELHAGDRVVLAGYTDDPGSVLDRASVVVTSTAFEGQPLSVVEALQHGVPVVAYDVRYGIRDVLAGGGGLLVRDGDVDGLAVALRRVLTDAELHARLIGETPEAVAGWSAEESVSALVAAVRRVLAAPPRR